MDSAQLLADAFDRVHGIVHRALEGLTRQDVAYRPDPEANSIAWLVWHLTRVQDGYVSQLVDDEQVWTAQDWAGTFDLPFDVSASGYGQSADEVGSVQTSADLLLGYFDAVHVRTVAYLATLTDSDLDAVVDASYDPPVTLGVRVISFLSDCLQHAGQAAYVRGLLQRAA
jgi:hypothetical protein